MGEIIQIHINYKIHFSILKSVRFPTCIITLHVYWLHLIVNGWLKLKGDGKTPLVVMQASSAITMAFLTCDVYGCRNFLLFFYVYPCNPDSPRVPVQTLGGPIRPHSGFHGDVGKPLQILPPPTWDQPFTRGSTNSFSSRATYTRIIFFKEVFLRVYNVIRSQLFTLRKTDSHMSVWY